MSKSYSSLPGTASHQMAAAVDALAEAWESHLSADADEPRLRDFLPKNDETLKRLVLPELVKADLEYRWQHDL